MSLNGDAWLAALSRYAYRVNLASFQNRGMFGPQWFQLELNPGDREDTLKFEDRFRQDAQEHLESWYEVVYWKMYSQGRRDHRTNQIIARVTQQHTRAPDLWSACSAFLNQFSRESFEVLQRLLIKSKAMPIVATFPAFMRPEDFPMIDSRVARWVSRFLAAFPGDRTCQPLISLTRDANTIYTHHWDFYQGWVIWCRKYANVLSDRTKKLWRARDVEMAVFQNAVEEALLPPIA